MGPVRPPRLRPGDTIASVSPSWGGPHAFPRVYEQGVRVLEDRFGLRVKEYPTTRMDPLDLYAHPERRAEDLTAAFEDPDVKGVLCTIGGDDSCRLLPLLDPVLGTRHPKVLLGFSDSTTLLVHFRLGGLVTFHGPSIMAGFSQLEALPREAERHLREVLFDATPRLDLAPFPAWSEGYPRWELEDSVGTVHPPRPHDGWHWVQGSAPVHGELFGGCLEVLEFLKGTKYWPSSEFWNGRVLFLETSEEVPTLNQVKWVVRNYGLQGVLGRIAALLFGRARGYSPAQKEELDRMVHRVVAEEFGLPELTVVTNLDFGHTDPQWVLPLGAEIAIDPTARELSLPDPAVR